MIHYRARFVISDVCGVSITAFDLFMFNCSRFEFIESTNNYRDDSWDLFQRFFNPNRIPKFSYKQYFTGGYDLTFSRLGEIK